MHGISTTFHRGRFHTKLRREQNRPQANTVSNGFPNRQSLSTIPSPVMLHRRTKRAHVTVEYVTFSHKKKRGGKKSNDRFMSQRKHMLHAHLFVYKCASFLCNCPYAHECELRSSVKRKRESRKSRAKIDRGTQ